MKQVGVINEKMGIAFRDGGKRWSFQNLEAKSRIHIYLRIRHVKGSASHYGSKPGVVL